MAAHVQGRSCGHVSRFDAGSQYGITLYKKMVSLQNMDGFENLLNLHNDSGRERLVELRRNRLGKRLQRSSYFTTTAILLLISRGNRG